MPDHMDPRWDSPLFRVWGDSTLMERRRHNGIVELGYPRAWEQCTTCKGTGQLAGTWIPSGTNRVESKPPMVCPGCFGTGAIKHLVRELAGHRCIRCGHPYVVGQEQFWEEPAEPETVVETAALALFDAEPTDEPRVKRERPIHWSPCDGQCTHGGPIRVRSSISHDWTPVEGSTRLAGPMTPQRLARGWEVQAAWRVLTVHHANEHKADCRWWNLLSLCQRCHLAIQGKVQMDRVYPHEHSEWFKPYVAGFYGWRYERRNLSRAEVEERMTELLRYELQQPGAL